MDENGLYICKVKTFPEAKETMTDCLCVCPFNTYAAVSTCGPRLFTEHLGSWTILFVHIRKPVQVHCRSLLISICVPLFVQSSALN